MPDLGFAVEGAAAVPYCATPTIGLALRVTNRAGDRVHAVALDCQVRIEAQRRSYTAAEQEGLADLFGEPSRWSQTLHSLLWAHAAVSVPPFEETAVVPVHLPCTADLNVLAARYFHALEDGGVPVTLLFSGSIFHAGPDGALQVARVPWSAEATYDLPVAAWREQLDLYFPNTAWLALRRDVFDRLHAYRASRGLLTWEQALEELLQGAPEGASR